MSYWLFILTILIVHTVHAHRSLHSLSRQSKGLNVLSNGSALRSDDHSKLVKRDGTKYVFMHHIVGNTYSFSIDDWKQDIQQIQAKGVDALALNIGSDPWQTNQVQNAYNAAQQLGTSFKLFLSLDFTVIPCNLGEVVSRVKQFSNHPNQFKINGRVFVSSFSGACLGDSGWASLKAQTNAYIMPFISGLEGQFNNWRSLDSWLCWGCAWSQGNYPKTTNDDNYYLGQLGNRYATSVSGWIYSHFGYKNFYLRGDDWLIVNRWEQLVAMRDRLTFVEMVTWNDFGESDYFGPIKGIQPKGTTWATNFPHTAWFDLSAYYITAFKTGRYPAITKDVIYFWARPHPAGATASRDSLPKPSGWDWTSDTMWAVAFTTAPATVVLKCGSSSKTFTVGSGITKLKIPLSPGKMTVQMIRSGQRIINYSPDGYTYITNPTTYNYNAWVGSASTTTITPRSPLPSTNTSSTAGPASPWTSYGCVAEGSTGSRRALTGQQFRQADMTPQQCQNLCSDYKYAGVEYGFECYCGDTLTNNGATGIVIPAINCPSSCGGDSNQKCGGSWSLNVFTRSDPTQGSSNRWTSAGCYTDADARVLRQSNVRRDDMSVDQCIGFCSSAGYTMAGMENGTECYCGSQFFKENGGGLPTDSSQCSTPCSGNHLQTCGGAWRVNVYLKSGTTI